MTTPVTYSVLLSVRDVAKQMSCSSACVYKLIGEKRLRHLRVGIGRGTIRVRQEDLAEYLAGCVQEERAEKRKSTPRPSLKHITL